MTVYTNSSHHNNAELSPPQTRIDSAKSYKSFSLDCRHTHRLGHVELKNLT